MVRFRLQIRVKKYEPRSIHQYGKVLESIRKIVRVMLASAPPPLLPEFFQASRILRGGEELGAAMKKYQIISASSRQNFTRYCEVSDGFVEAGIFHTGKILYCTVLRTVDTYTYIHQGNE